MIFVIFRVDVFNVPLKHVVPRNKELLTCFVFPWKYVCESLPLRLIIQSFFLYLSPNTTYDLVLFEEFPKMPEKALKLAKQCVIWQIFYFKYCLSFSICLSVNEHKGSFIGTVLIAKNTHKFWFLAYSLVPKAGLYSS